PANRNFAAEVLLRWNQVQGEEAMYLQRLSRRSNSPTIQQLAGKIRAERKALSLLANQENTVPNALQISLDRLAKLEVELSQKSHDYKQHLAARDLDLNDIRASLPTDGALIALKIYRPIDIENSTLKSPHYLALLIPADDERAIQLRDLGKVEDSIIFNTSLQAGKDQAAGDLYQKLFGDWDKQLAQYDSLYIIPDGQLHLINFERLKLPDDRYWIERQPLYRLQTARDLIRPKPEQQGKGFIAIGGINYGENNTIQVALNDTQRNLAGQLQNGFTSLAATRKEAQQIAEYFWHPDNQKPQLWLDNNATEHRLKNLKQPPQILHLATHGFYLEDQQQLERPMVLSGLALAGANTGIQGKTDQHGDDGVLYAMEVLDLNLEGTQLVTLSACETGEGEIDYSEGVYGLIRAFRIAGAQHILMTLRKVEDEAAFQFMDSFYFNWFENGKFDNPAVALRKTKLDFIKQGKPTEFWSPYVL
ncbi:MAG: CHAT domain-containing protein, partial [Myxococcota bacterium]